MLSNSEKETFNEGVLLGEKLEAGDIVLLEGDLGAGKTVFTKGIAEGLKIPTAKEVKSPTFNLVHEMNGDTPLFHFDLYRLESETDLFDIGFDDYLERDGVVVIEWGDKFESYVPKAYYKVKIEHRSENTREITVKDKA